MDEWQYEHAARLSDALISGGVDEIRKQVPKGIGPEFCEECDDSIHPDRRALGYATCIDCAERAERQH
jgi:RNA polymerase-binding transcription factor DksA